MGWNAACVALVVGLAAAGCTVTSPKAPVGIEADEIAHGDETAVQDLAIDDALLDALPPVGEERRSDPETAPPIAEEKEEPILSHDAVYRLRAGDEIDIQIYREPQLSGAFRIEPSGAIRHPLLGALEVAGMSVKEAEVHVTGVLAADYLVNPRVILKLLSVRNQHVVILGAVRKPGVYNIPVGQSWSLLQAIAEAGGFADVASPDRVRIVRNVDGESQTIRVRVSGLLSGRGREQDVPLLPHDVIMVPEIIF